MRKSFWVAMLFSVVLGVLLPWGDLLFILGTDFFLELWTGEEPDFGLLGGKWWWIGLCTGGGALVGAYRYFLNLQDFFPTFQDDLREKYVHLDTMPHVLALCFISISSGASLGPEAGLGCLGGGVAVILTKLPHPFALSKATKEVIVLAGFAAAFGGLMTSPILALTIVLEISLAKSFETMYTCMVSSCIAFALFYWIAGDGLLGIYSVGTYDFELWNMGMAVVFGIAASVIDLILIICLGVSKKICQSLREKFPKPSKLFLPIFGGLVVGVVGSMFPYTIGSGSTSLAVVVGRVDAVSVGSEDFVDSPGYLTATVFLKMITLGICSQCGFVGGTIFPLLFIGGVSGCVIHLLFPWIPLGLAFSCMFAAVPGGLVAAPKTFLLIACFTIQIGLEKSTSVAVSMVSSYLVLNGMGIMQKLQQSAQKKEQEQQQQQQYEPEGLSEQTPLVQE